jgi:hypothetical protein
LAETTPGLDGVADRAGIDARAADALVSIDRDGRRNQDLKVGIELGAEAEADGFDGVDELKDHVEDFVVEIIEFDFLSLCEGGSRSDSRSSVSY